MSRMSRAALVIGGVLLGLSSLGQPALARSGAGEKYVTYTDKSHRYKLRYPASWNVGVTASPLPDTVSGYRFPSTIVGFGDFNGPTSDSLAVVTATPPATAGPASLRSIERTMLLTGSQPLGKVAYGTRRIRGVTYETARLSVKTDSTPQQQTVVGTVHAGTAYFFVASVDQHTTLAARDTARLEQMYESITLR